MANHNKYLTIIFDCDGVILNSNSLKVQAFYEAALPYGEELAKKLVAYHVTHGGISRYLKFKYFLEHIVPSHVSGPSLEELLHSYADIVWKGLLSCEIADGLEALKLKTPDTRWLVVSGSDQSELRKILNLRGLEQLFDGGIFGSPDTKDDILTREFTTENIVHPALYIGDSRYDYEAATRANLDFIFLSQWSECEYLLNKKNLTRLHNIKDVVKFL